MTTRPMLGVVSLSDHQAWIHSRLLLDKALQDAVREGFALVATGFGSFAIFDGLSAAHERDVLPKTFALVATAVGIIVTLLALTHFRKMTVWIDADEFGTDAVPTLPDERRPTYLAAGVVVIGAVSFIALLFLI